MYSVRVGMDDANVGTSTGECRGHEWVLHGLQFDLTGARMSRQCRWCGALSYTPSKRD